VLRGGIRFFEQAHIKDVLAHLRVIANPKDELSWKRILGLQAGIGRSISDQVWQKAAASGFSISKILSKNFKKELPSRAIKGWDKLAKLLQALNSTQNKDAPARQIEEILRYGYNQHVITTFENAQDRLDDLEELANFAYTHESTESFLSEITLREDFKGETVKGYKIKEEEHLVLSTIHQAKGLEWHAVFIIGACEGQFPHPKSVDDPAQLEEERRLFYVASTRAKRQLYITHPILRYDHNWGEIITRPSVFVQELPISSYDKWYTESEEEEEYNQDLSVF
jgi:DNA helicase-2/ATP-dependent DNA helicase PcrA